MPLTILLEDSLLLVVRLADKLLFCNRNNHVRQADGSTKKRCILITDILDGVEHLNGDGVVICLQGVADQSLQFLVAKSCVLERNTLGKDGIEKNSTGSGLNLGTILKFISNLCIIREQTTVKCHLQLTDVVKVLAFTGGTLHVTGQVVDTEDHVL